MCVCVCVCVCVICVEEYVIPDMHRHGSVIASSPGLLPLPHIYG